MHYTMTPEKQEMIDTDDTEGIYSTATSIRLEHVNDSSYEASLPSNRQNSNREPYSNCCNLQPLQVMLDFYHQCNKIYQEAEANFPTRHSQFNEHKGNRATRLAPSRHRFLKARCDLQRRKRGHFMALLHSQDRELDEANELRINLENHLINLDVDERILQNLWLKVLCDWNQSVQSSNTSIDTLIDVLQPAEKRMRYSE